MSERLTDIVADLARATATDLAPHWRDRVSDSADDRDALARLCADLGWQAPQQLPRRPRAHQLPALVYSEDTGWAIAEEWEGPDRLRVRIGHASEVRPHDGAMRFFRVLFPDAARSGERLSASKIFRDALLRRRGAIATALVATIVVNIIALVTSLYSMQVYDRVIPRAGFSTLWVLTIGVLIALALDFLLRTVRTLLMDREAADIDMEVSEYFFARAQAVRLDARSGGVGTMAAQLRGMDQVRSLYSSASLFLLADFPFAIFFLFVIWALGGIIVLVPLIAFPLSLGLAALLARLIRDGTDRAQVTGNRKNGLLVEMLDSAETVKANRGGWFMLSRWNALIEAVIGDEEPVRKWSSIAGSVFGTVQQIAYIALVAFGAIEVARGRMTMGALIAATIVAGRVNGPLMAQLPSMIVQWGYARASLRALDTVLAMPADGQLGAAALRPDSLKGALRIERVEFAYPGTKDGLQVPMLDIRPGERVGLIGGIGSGKTTLLRIMAGLYAPMRGIVTLDGLDMGRIAESVLRRDVGYLPQEFRLVNGTLRENLLMGLSDPGDQVVLQTAVTTGLIHLISAHPLGLDLPISEGGRGLSGGQRTLTGLTRLLLANPKLWLLDEPTSNLDMGTEAAVMSALTRRLDAESTMVLVTHKVALLQMCTRTIVMANGRITHDGPTQAVLNNLQRQGVAQMKTAAQAAAEEAAAANAAAANMSGAA
ncbi:ATP-binding cassette domain-containing protein [uncultured Sphingomonas sp.]|uniref:ATP-binding cassette domain-containing protein n=1 Tax=uncultured Sphingomonas sp. TaxID=158754 RepID=UPI0025E02DE5|nr:ATP-binding cassette domain-containing protein [uncultured Sphingomonas sp.]